MKKLVTPLITFLAGLVLGCGIGFILPRGDVQTRSVDGLQSPDKTKVVYPVLENARIALYVSDLRGAGVKKIAEQEVAEGSGELDVSTIQWSGDSTSVTYVETSLRCEMSCVNPDDFVSVQTTYQVDVRTAEKTMVGERR